MSLPQDILDYVQQWRAFDTDTETLNEVSQLVEQNNEQELRKIMSKRIDFGTAGIFMIMVSFTT